MVFFRTQLLRHNQTRGNEECVFISQKNQAVTFKTGIEVEVTVPSVEIVSDLGLPFDWATWFAVQHISPLHIPELMF